jgi:Ran GTPase-activating protein (RanGAP) involved in mRNA processing and transport
MTTLNHMTTLRIGNLRDSKVRESTVVRRLREAAEDISVNELYFWQIEFTQRVVDELWKLLAGDYRIWNSIKLLSCTGHVDAAVSTIFHYECVQSLVLSGAQTSQAALQAVDRGLARNESVKTIRLLGVHLAEEGTSFEGLTQNQSLLELDLTRSHLAKGAVEALTASLPDNRGLETIKLEQCNLDDDDMTAIVDSLYDHPSVRHLDFSQNSAHSRALEAIADLLASEESMLTSLNLSSQLLGENEELNLSSLSKAVAALKTNTSLTQLDISGNKYSDAAVEALVACLSANSTLETLEVNDSHISEYGIRIFAKNLPGFKSLKVLNIGGNDFGEEVAECLVRGLKYNRTLKSLGLIEECSKSHIIEHFLDLNMAGRRAMQNDIPLAVWPLLLARASVMEMPVLDDEALRSGRNESVLYSLLRGPALFER